MKMGYRPHGKVSTKGSTVRSTPVFPLRHRQKFRYLFIAIALSTGSTFASVNHRSARHRARRTRRSWPRLISEWRCPRPHGCNDSPNGVHGELRHERLSENGLQNSVVLAHRQRLDNDIGTRAADPNLPGCALTHEGLARKCDLGSVLKRQMETRSDDRCEILFDIAELAADIVGQARRNEKVDGYLLVVFDLPALARRVSLIVNDCAEARTSNRSVRVRYRASSSTARVSPMSRSIVPT